MLQVAAAGALVALLVHVARVWPALPASVPTHFGASGPPDAWGSRASLLFLPALATVFFVGLSLLERVPHRYNYPVEVTAANAPLLYALGRRLVLSLKLIVVVAFGFIFRVAADVAIGRATVLPGWFLPAIVAAAALVILVGVVRMTRARADVD